MLFKKEKKHIWYACYGSNLSAERFTSYIQGGICRFNGKEYAGCRDRSGWLASEKAFFPGEIYFGNESATWAGGGVAFFDPEGTEEVLMRLYKITYEQFLDVQVQEGTSPNWYGRKVLLGKHPDGCRIYTMTSEERRPQNPPDQSYYHVIHDALSDELAMGKEWTDEYMEKWKR